MLSAILLIGRGAFASEFINQIDNMKTIIADFHQDEITSGIIYVDRLNNRVRIEYFDPEHIILILNKNLITLYNVALNQIDYLDTKHSDMGQFLLFDMSCNDAIVKNSDDTVKIGIDSENQHLDMLFSTDSQLLYAAHYSNYDSNINMFLTNIRVNEKINNRLFSVRQKDESVFN